MARGRYVKEPGAKKGYYLPCPICHHKVCTCVEDRLLRELELAGVPLPSDREYRFSESRLWKADFAYPNLRILIEVEGGGGRGRHTNVIGYRNDMIKYNTISGMGYRLYRFDKAMIVSGLAAKTIQAAIVGSVYVPQTEKSLKVRKNAGKRPKTPENDSKSTKKPEKARAVSENGKQFPKKPSVSQRDLPDHLVTDPVEAAIRAARNSPVYKEGTPIGEQEGKTK